MLRVIQSKNEAQARSYYSKADYYSEGQELTGLWAGKAAAMLGLAGNVTQAQWESLCDNRHPETGERLTRRRNKERTQGYDFNFHVPKSLSLLFADTRDERILDAVRETVDSIMQDVETEMATRVRKGGKQENRTTGNIAYGAFVHFTARPVDSVPDPHLHIHCFVHNITFDEKEQQWKAGQFRALKTDAPHFEAMFHARLAARLSDLGLPIERSKHGWELAGIGKAFIEKFSRRTAEIENKARAMGVTDPVAKSELGAKTREHKRKDLPFRQLQAVWRGRMTAAERKALAILKAKLGGDTEPRDDTAAGQGTGKRLTAATFIDDTLRRQAFFAAWSRQRASGGWRHTARGRV